MREQDILEIAKGYCDLVESVRYTIRWNGWEVYEPLYNREDCPKIGRPHFILVRGEQARMTGLDEGMRVYRAILEILGPDEDESDEDSDRE